MPIERQIPQYQSHKKVWALKIKNIFYSSGDHSGILVFEDGSFDNRAVTGEYMDKHTPVIGGYFVQYEDGYESFSPADAFESGYTPINTCSDSLDTGS